LSTNESLSSDSSKKSDNAALDNTPEENGGNSDIADEGQGDSIGSIGTENTSSSTRTYERKGAVQQMETANIGGISSNASSNTPTLSSDERAAALPLYQALSQYGHVGHLFLSAAAAWFDLEEARNKFAHAHARVVPKHATGSVFDEWRAFLRIPSPDKWEGCAACKGSTRVEGGELCPSCKGGFTTHAGEGVTTDVVAAHAAELSKSKVV
jgi:hypothetical protein